jgi:hypothetical protein
LHQLENGLGGICFAVLVGTFALSGVAAICFFIGCGILRIAPGLEIVILRLTRWEPRNLADRRKVETSAAKKLRLYRQSKKLIARERIIADAARRERLLTLVTVDAVPCEVREFVTLKFPASCPNCKHDRQIWSQSKRVCLLCATSRVMEPHHDTSF